jgi:Invasion associated locus B (IalB) protein
LPQLSRNFGVKGELHSAIVKAAASKIGIMTTTHSSLRGLFFTITTLVSLGQSTVARAEDPTSLGKFGDWEAFTYKTADSTVCYAFSAPIKTKSSKKVTRDPAYFMISNFPNKKVKGQVSTIIGYSFDPNSEVDLKVGDKSFSLYPVGNGAWADKAETEKIIITAMKKAKSFTVSGISSKGTNTIDSYSTNGISGALGKIDGTCK